MLMVMEMVMVIIAYYFRALAPILSSYIIRTDSICVMLWCHSPYGQPYDKWFLNVRPVVPAWLCFGERIWFGHVRCGCRQVWYLVYKLKSSFWKSHSFYAIVHRFVQDQNLCFVQEQDSLRGLLDHGVRWLLPSLLLLGW